MTNHPQPWYGTCPTCGKRSFPTRKAARKAIRSIGDGDHMSAYRCDTSWHIGHLPTAVINGTTTRQHITNRKATR